MATEEPISDASKRDADETKPPEEPAPDDTARKSRHKAARVRGSAAIPWLLILL
jgi:hypothetical protein